MTLGISVGLHHCRIGDDYVFLDVPRDRYFMLSGPPAQRFRSFLSGTAAPSDLEWLVQRELLVAGGMTPRNATVPVPGSSLAEIGPVRRSLPLTAEAVLRQRFMQRSLKRTSLQTILGRTDTAQLNSTEGDPETYRSVAQAFRQSRRYVTAVDMCLPRGLAMVQMLGRKRCRATLVFGVTLPFAAHCWVQWGSHVLTDDLDVVRPFTPIYVL